MVWMTSTEKKGPWVAGVSEELQLMGKCTGKKQELLGIIKLLYFIKPQKKNELFFRGIKNITV